MKVVSVLLLSSACCLAAAIFCKVAEIMTHAGSPLADAVGYIGLGLCGLAFIGGATLIAVRPE